MKIYFCGLKEPENFDVNVHCCEDTPLLHGEIFQKEGEVAIARLVIPAEDVLNHPHQWSWISCEMDGQVIPLFLGIRSPTIDYQDDHRAIMTFLAIPLNWREQMEEHRSHLPKDSLIFHEEDGEDPLYGYSRLWHFHPITHEVKPQSIFQGTSTIVLKDDFLQKSFVQKFAPHPYEAIHGEVIAEWVQELEGEINFFPLISQNFPSQMINTLTPHELIKTWPKEGTWIKRSGYFISRSYLEIHPPPVTGSLDIYPRLTKKVFFDNQVYQFRRFWLTGALDVVWQYRQKRRQRVTFVINHGHPDAGKGRGEIKKLSFHVNMSSLEFPIGTADFFQTSLGQQAVLKAIQKAQCYLAGSARNLRYQGMIPFESRITTDQDIHFIHPHDKQQLRGRVIDYRHIFTPKGWFTYLTCAVIDGLGERELPGHVDIIAEEGVQGMIHREDLTPLDFIDSLVISNGPEDQINKVEEMGSLHVPATQIDFILKDLRSKPCLHQTLRVDKALIW